MKNLLSLRKTFSVLRSYKSRSCTIIGKSYNVTLPLKVYLFHLDFTFAMFCFLACHKLLLKVARAARILTKYTSFSLSSLVLVALLFFLCFSVTPTGRGIWPPALSWFCWRFLPIFPAHSDFLLWSPWSISGRVDSNHIYFFGRQ